ncbi:MAG: transferase, partial [Bacteroidia bacterium]
MKEIVIVGSGGFAREVGFLIEEINRVSPEWDILGYIDENQGEYNGKYKIINNDDWLEQLGHELYVVFGIGNPNLVKKLLSRFSNNENLKYPNLIHPGVIADWERII